MPFGCGQAWVELKAPNHVENRVLGKHQFEKGILVQQKDILENVVEVVQALHVFQVFAHVEQVQQLFDVPAERF